MITYTNEFEDLLVFNEYLHKFNDYTKKNVSKIKLNKTIGCLALICILAFATKDTLYLIIGSIFVVIVYLGMAGQVMANDVKEFNKQLKDGLLDSFLSIKTISYDEKELTLKNSSTTLSTKFDKITKIIDHENFIYIFLSVNTAHIIPKDRIESGDLDTFLEQLKKKIEV